MYSIYFFADTPNLRFKSGTLVCGSVKITIEDFARYVRMRFRNKNMFNDRFVKVCERMYSGLEGQMLEDFQQFVDEMKVQYAVSLPYSFHEAFMLNNGEWRSIVFGQINVAEMIENLGASRIATAGRLVRHKQFNSKGNFTGYREYDVIFETHRVNGTKLGLVDDIYAVKCWCTTTESEHWIWIESQYKTDPLAAIASTFRVHANVIPFIKELKRQGDILLVEMEKQVTPVGEMVPLTTEQYFSLLTAQS
jgi:hypothetical protein